MKISWKILFTKTLFWLTTEISLTLMGIDDLADYGEFIFEKPWYFNATLPMSSLIIS